MSRLIFAHTSVLIQIKFDSLVTMVNKNIDVFLISETKIDFSFPTAQFHIEGNRYIHGGRMLLSIRKDITSSLLNSDVSTEGFFVELNLRKKKWL